MARCALRCVVLLARRRLHQPKSRVGAIVHFADGSSAAVYRETVAGGPMPPSSCALVVCFRLRRVRSERLHRLFRLESILNTILFAGFPGFRSKLWLRHDDHHRYRGVYDWADPATAHDYARALWRVLALLSEPGSIDYVVVPGVRRDDLVAGHGPVAPGEWWLPVDVTWW